MLRREWRHFPQPGRQADATRVERDSVEALQELSGLLRIPGSRHVIALNGVAAERAQRGELLASLDAFRDHHELQGMSEVDHAADEGGAVGIRVQAFDEQG